MSQSGIRQNIDWLYTTAGNAPPASIEAWFYPVMFAVPVYNAVRGPIGATDCLYIAVLHIFAGHFEEGLSWLYAAQGHNPTVVDDFKNNKEYTMKYALESYLPLAAQRYGEVVSSFTKEKARLMIDRVSEELKNRSGGVRPPFPSPPREREAEPRGPNRDKSLDIYSESMLQKIYELYERLLAAEKEKADALKIKTNG